MKRHVLKGFIIILALFTFAASYGSLYVQSRKAKILAEPTFRAKTVATVNKAAKLTLLEKKSRWYRVSYNGKKGWISSMVVGPRPPMKRLSVADKRRGDIRKYARRRASVVTATAAARGLAQDDRRRLGGGGAVDFVALESIEALEITDDELADFIEQTK
jgi:uncharacterized protein YgiM (DUF1202 family)